ncbi:hypothetical protein [Clostridium kluyveri]|uniref:Uncharacterized protein n=2 Tax=Clostridium kluyveri TaxID=1534 RepID=A5N1E3_CLOK5|nr:hypothetical protein [Clostridium kluyveri]EDK34939.1 Conserved hypothetical protein [Clostridium kluyveri DSM 555]
MSDLKYKLAKKINTIEDDDSINNTESIRKDTNNVITLNSTESNKSISIVPDFAITLNDAKNRVELLQSFVKEMMIINIDYGFIPNCSKPSLFKSGAEKLCDIFGFSKKIEILNRVEDWEKALFHYEIKTILINKKTGLIEAEGIGSCNNRERKYKNQDGYSIVNNILKMAKKRAFIDAVLSATRSSGLFTQDMEDNLLPLNNGNDDKDITKIQSNNTNGSAETKYLQNKKYHYELISIIKENNIPTSEIKELIKKRYKVSQIKQLSSPQICDFIKYLNIYNMI